MPAEKIIEQIKKDSQKKVEQILKEAERQATDIVNDAIKKAKKESEEILSNGEKQSESIKKILISKANQDAKRKITKAKETIIKECFEKAQHKLTDIGDREYEKLATKLISEGSEKLGGNCTVQTSRNVDKKVAKKLGIKATGKIEATGGIILTSSNGKITLDNTFEGILRREKERIRIKVGKLLFT